MKQRKFFYISICFISVIAAGCMMGDNYTRPIFFNDVEIEKALNLSPKISENKKNIFDFQDKTLNTIINYTLENSPDIRIAVYKVRQAREAYSVQNADLFPAFDLNAQYNFIKESQNMNLLSEQDYYQTTLDMSWEIDIFGGNRRRAEAKRANYQQSIENLKNVYISLIAEVCMAYISLRNSEQNLKNAQKNLDIQQELFTTIYQEYNSGLTDDIALNQSKYLLNTIKMTIPQFEHQKRLALNTLSFLAGQLPKKLDIILEQKEKNIISDSLNYNMDEIRNLSVSVIRNRPDVRMAEEQLIAGNALVGAAIADMFPQISLSAFLGFESLNANKLFNHKSYEYGAVPGVNIPVFHFRALKNNLEIQKAIKAENLEQYRQSLLNAVSEISNAISALKTEQERNISTKNAYHEMEKVVSLQRNKYEKGLIKYSDVLDAEQQKLSAEKNMVDSNTALYQNIVTFYKSIGGMTSEPIGF